MAPCNPRKFDFHEDIRISDEGGADKHQIHLQVLSYLACYPGPWAAQHLILIYIINIMSPFK